MCPKPMTGVLIEGDIWTRTHTGVLWEDEGRDLDDTPPGQGMPEMAGQPPRRQAWGQTFPLSL